MAITAEASTDSRRDGTPRPLSLRLNFSWTILGNIVYSGCQWGMLVVLAKLGSPEIVGQLAFGLAVTGPIFMVAGLQLRAVQATDAKQQYRFRDYLTLRALSTVLAVAVIAVISFACGYRRETGLVLLALATAKAFEAVSDVVYGALQQRERMDRIAHSQMIHGPLSLVAMACAVYLSGSLVWGLVALAVVRAVVLMTYDLPSVSWIQQDREVTGPTGSTWTTLITLAWLALPLGAIAALSSLKANLPLYFVKHFLGDRELGILAAMIYVTVIGDKVVSALAQSTLPRFANYYAANEIASFVRLLLRTVAVCAILGIAGVLVAAFGGRFLLTILYSPTYGLYASTFFCLMCGVAFRYVATFLYTALRASRRFALLLCVDIISFAALFVLAFFLIPHYGILGAAWAILLYGLFEMATYTLLTIVLLWQSSKQNAASDDHGSGSPSQMCALET